jgi:hypothetical protein
MKYNILFAAFFFIAASGAEAVEQAQLSEIAQMQLSQIEAKNKYLMKT